MRREALQKLMEQLDRPERYLGSTLSQANGRLVQQLRWVDSGERRLIAGEWHQQGSKMEYEFSSAQLDALLTVAARHATDADANLRRACQEYLKAKSTG